METIQEIELTESMISNIIDKIKDGVERYRIRRMKTQVLYDPKTFRMAAAVISPKETGYMILDASGNLESQHKVSDRETMKAMDDLKNLGWKTLSRATPTRVISSLALIVTGSLVGTVSLFYFGLGLALAFTGQLSSDISGMTAEDALVTQGIMLAGTVGGWVIAKIGATTDKNTLHGFDKNPGPEQIRKNTERNVLN